MHTANSVWAPEIRRQVLAAHAKRLSLRQIETAFGVPKSTIADWVIMAEEGESLQSPGRRGRKRKLSSAEVATISAALEDDAYASNKDLAKRVGNKIAPCSVSRYLKRATPPFTEKEVRDDQNSSSSPAILQAGLNFYRQVSSVPLATRVYEDESFLYDNEAPKQGRSRRGERINRRRKRHGEALSFCVCDDPRRTCG